MVKKLVNHLTDENVGWKLSPAYDLNPIVGKHGLDLNISDTVNELDSALAFEVIDFVRLSRSEQLAKQKAFNV
ncbi:hypothetical protein BJJ97_04250 [Pectobacterium polaris]|nr:HipA domain-containing protein [Pectobacterium polaris]ASY75172.1 hypothetical protein BJJ97_04250 [Pectobacterium polaris]MDG0803318.1 HipA domain-containing protein [Pectobacterium polaris]